MGLLLFLLLVVLLLLLLLSPCVLRCITRLLQPYEQQSWHNIFNYNTHTNNLTTTQEAAC